MSLGKDVLVHAGTSAVYNPDVHGFGLKQLLQIMNYSKLFTLGSASGGTYTGIYDVVNNFFFNVDDPLVASTKPLGVVADNKADWDLEIEALIDLVDTVKTKGLQDGDMATKLTDFAWTDTASVLDALNNSTIVRSVLPDLVYDAVENAGMEEWVGDWLIDQTGVDGVVAPFAEWEAEIPRLAKLISVAMELGLDANSMNLKDIELGQGLAMHAGDDPEYNPATAHPAGLQQLLQLMNSSSAFILGTATPEGAYTGLYKVINDYFFAGDDAIIISQKSLGIVGDDKADWDDEINALITLLVDIRSNNLADADMAQVLKTKPKENISQLLGNLNETTIVRVVIPDLIHDSLVASNATDWENIWLTNQVGNNPVELKTEWQAEFAELANVISSFNVLGDMGSLDVMAKTGDNYDVNLTVLEGALLSMNNGNIFKLQPMGGILEDALDGVGIAGVQVTNYPTTKVQWEDEITDIFAMIENMREVGSLDTSAIKTKAETTGSMLNLMKETTMLGGSVFDEVVDSFITRTDYYKDADNPNGIFDDQYLTDMKAWTQYDWEDELAVVGEFELDQETQSGRMIDKMATSGLLLPLITDEANKHIARVNAELVEAFGPLAPSLELLDETEVLVRSNTTTWEREIRALEAVIDQIDADTFPGNFDLDEDDKTDGSGNTTIGWDICYQINNPA